MIIDHKHTNKFLWNICVLWEPRIYITKIGNFEIWWIYCSLNLNQWTSHKNNSHQHWLNSHFLAIAFFRRLLDFFLRHSRFHLFGFCNNNIFIEQGRQPKVQPPAWNIWYIFISPATRCPSYSPSHGIPFSSYFTTRRAIVEVFSSLHMGI
jgi:hypothetical protein